MKYSARSIIMAAGLLGAGTGAASAATQLINNGGFEAGNSLPGWTVVNEANSFGSWFADTDGSAPLSGLTTAGPAAGSRYAVFGAGGSAASALLQSFTVPLGATSVMFSYQLFVDNYRASGAVVNPASLSYTAGPNQHARVDLLNITAGALSTAGVDVVQNFYLGADAGANPHSYVSYVFDITSLVTPGSSYQVRFAAVLNQALLSMGVDNVSVLAETADVPETSTYAAVVALVGLVGFTGWRRVRR